MKSIILLIVMLWFSAGLFCQETPYYFRHYEVEDGLSNNTVHCSMQDQKGFIWFGTIDGLNRFDGYSFKTFRHDPADPKSLQNNSVFSLHAGKKDEIWVGTARGLVKYDPLYESFELITVTSDRRVGSICEDARGTIWFTLNGILSRYDPALRIFNQPDTENTIFTSICIDYTGKLWAATSTGSLRGYDLSINTYTSFNLFSAANNSSDKIEKIFDTRKGQLLIGTSNKLFKVFDVRTNRYEDVTLEDHNQTHLFAKEFLQYAANEYWIATENGLFVYDSDRRRFTVIRADYTNPFSLSDNAISTILKDREGGVWVGTRFGGVNYYPYPYTLFNKYFSQANKFSIRGNGVHEICPDGQGNLWIGTEDAGLNKVNLQSGMVKNFSPDGRKGSISYSNIHGLLVVDDELWIGTFQHGLDRLSLKTERVIKHYQAGENSFTGDFIVHLFKAGNGTIYVGTWDGLFTYQKAGDTFIPVTGFNFQTQNMLEDENGLLWICTLGNGVYTLEQKTGKITNFRHEAGNVNSLCSNMVNGQFLDSKKRMWFATEGGLCSYDPNTKKFLTYAVKDGLPSNFLFKILEDNRNNLWVSSTKGLFCFNPVTKGITVYTTADGLLNDQFNWNSAYKDPRGEMYFGSVKGMISFMPDKFTNNNLTPPVYITGIHVNNRELPIRRNSPLEKSVTYSDKITLEASESTLSIDFAALSFTSARTNDYAYKMEGLDKDWTFLNTNRRVYFTQIPPGEYTFKIKAANSSGLWNQKETVLKIKILPPFWATNWAMLVYTAFAAFIAFLIVQNYHKWISEKNKRRIDQIQHEKESELYRNKIDFFTDVAHEIRTPLTLIQGPLENIMNHAEDMPEIKGNLKIMARNTDRLLHIANQLLDFRQTEVNNFRLNLEYINVYRLLEDFHMSFEPLAKQRGLRLSLETPEQELYAFADADSLQKILSNLYSNAIKYAKSDIRVILYAVELDNKFRIEIANDGFIIPYDLREKIFEPFFRIKETNMHEGTGIGLALSRTLAELNRATLILKETDNGMNVFVFEAYISHETDRFDSGVRK